MQPSMFNLRIPLEARNEVFLMNTLTDAELIVSQDVASLIDRCADGFEDFDSLDGESREALDILQDNGFLVPNREADQRALDRFFATTSSDVTRSKKYRDSIASYMMKG